MTCVFGFDDLIQIIRLNSLFGMERKFAFIEIVIEEGLAKSLHFPMCVYIAVILIGLLFCLLIEKVKGYVCLFTLLIRLQGDLFLIRGP